MKFTLVFSVLLASFSAFAQLETIQLYGSWAKKSVECVAARASAKNNGWTLALAEGQFSVLDKDSVVASLTMHVSPIDAAQGTITTVQSDGSLNFYTYKIGSSGTLLELSTHEVFSGSVCPFGDLRKTIYEKVKK